MCCVYIYINKHIHISVCVCLESYMHMIMINHLDKSIQIMHASQQNVSFAWHKHPTSKASAWRKISTSCLKLSGKSFKMVLRMFAASWKQLRRQVCLESCQNQTSKFWCRQLSLSFNVMQNRSESFKLSHYVTHLCLCKKCLSLSRLSCSWLPTKCTISFIAGSEPSATLRRRIAVSALRSTGLG